MSSPLDGAARSVALLLVVSLWAAVPAVAVGAEESAGKVPALAGGEGGTAAEPAGVAVPDGSTIAWSAAEGRMVAPSAEQAARLAAALRQLFLAKAAEPGFRRLARPGEVDELVLPNGMKRSRLTSDRMSFSLVRVDAEGGLIPSCADGVEAAAGALAAPVSDAVEER